MEKCHLIRNFGDIILPDWLIAYEEGKTSSFCSEILRKQTCEKGVTWARRIKKCCSQEKTLVYMNNSGCL